MSNNQLFFALITALILLLGLTVALIKSYIDIKLDPMFKEIKLLGTYMISHESKITVLQDRTRPK